MANITKPTYNEEFGQPLYTIDRARFGHAKVIGGIGVGRIEPQGPVVADDSPGYTVALEIGVTEIIV